MKQKYAAKEASEMEVYQIESQIVEQREIFEKVAEYVRGQAMSKPLHEVERDLFSMMLQLGLSLLKEVVARHGDGKIDGKITCEDGEPLSYRDLRKRNYLSVFGPMEIVRAYYWEDGRQGVCPLDAKLNLPQGKTSYLLEQWILADVARMPYEEALERLGDILRLQLWKGEHRVEAAHVARNADAFYRGKSAPPPETEGAVICATADCKGVRMVPAEKPEHAKPPAARLGKGEKTGLRKDAVVTSDFTFVPGRREPQEMARILMREQTAREKDAERTAAIARKERGEAEPRVPLNQQRAATMDGKQKAAADLSARIAKRDPQETKPIYILIDGERALESALLQEFTQRGWDARIDGVCLDIFHVMEYMWETGTALFGERSPGRQDWVHQQARALLQGRVGYVIGALRHTLAKRGRNLKAHQKNSLNKAIKYFDNHRHMMRYDIFLEKGYPIGTGVIEGACGSLVKARMDGSGKRWTKQGAQAILDLRAIQQNGDWNRFWEFYISCEHNRLYHPIAA
jgi:hypothetical protein